MRLCDAVGLLRVTDDADVFRWFYVIKTTRAS